MKKELLNKLKNIHLFLFDLEGVLFNKGDDEVELVNNIKNAAQTFNKRNLFFGIITARSEDSLIKELKKIEGCEVMASSLNKVNAAEKLLTRYSLDYSNILFVGDEVIDIPLLQKSGVAIAPKHAKREVKRVSHLIINAVGAAEIFNEIFSLISKSITE